MATAVVEERQLLKSLRWWDGFAIAMCNPGFLFGSLGFTLGIFGVWGSVILWGISGVIGWILTWIYVEPAMMFPNKSGGISLYAHEAWRKYTTFVGPIATFGYWIGWSVVLAIFGKIIGDLIQARWFSSTTFTVYDGVVHLGLAHFIAIGVIAAVWAFNIYGIRPMKGLTYLTAGLLTVRAVRVHIRPLPDRRLALEEPPRDIHRPVGRHEARDRLHIHPRLVILGGRGMRHLRARVQDAPRHDDGAAQLGAVRGRRVRAACRSASAASRAYRRRPRRRVSSTRARSRRSPGTRSGRSS